MRISKATFTVVAAVFCGASLISPANAGNSFDGAWSVRVVSNPGCTDAYSVSIRVEDGSIKYESLLLRAIGSGKVNPKGRLTAQIGQAMVNGKLATRTGAGKWHSPRCTGTWTASRAAV